MLTAPGSKKGETAAAHRERVLTALQRRESTSFGYCRRCKWKAPRKLTRTQIAGAAAIWVCGRCLKEISG